MGAQRNQPPRTHPDPLGIFVQVKGSPFDSVRCDIHSRPPGVSLTRKRSLAQIKYGPCHFSKTRLALTAQMRASDLGFAASLLVRAPQVEA
jgi:hypothetical protein